jgi:hypothetical protein
LLRLGASAQLKLQDLILVQTSNGLALREILYSNKPYPWLQF